ncbi:MAG: hypothetical protein ACO29O_06415, partial [Chitinophagaceae bacterium]
MKKVKFLRYLLLVLFVGLSSIAIQAHTITREHPVKGKGLSLKPTPPVVLGAITIVASGGDAEDYTWTYSNGTISTTASSASIDATAVIAKMATGDLTIEASTINVNADLTNSANAYRLTLKATDNIIVDAGISITSNDGDVILWANSDVSGDGSITLGDNTTINTVNGSTASGLTSG